MECLINARRMHVSFQSRMQISLWHVINICKYCSSAYLIGIVGTKGKACKQTSNLISLPEYLSVYNGVEDEITMVRDPGNEKLRYLIHVRSMRFNNSVLIKRGARWNPDTQKWVSLISNLESGLIFEKYKRRNIQIPRCWTKFISFKF